MRLRNVKGANDKIIKSKYIILDFEKYKGQFNKLFENNNPIHLEIGMGKGDFLIGNALKYPNINFIGIEKFDSVIVRAVEKLEEYDLPNLKIIRVDANLVNDIFFKEIDVLYLNFSDPWPKDRHAKRRLTSTYFLEKYENIFKNEKCIIMKTDNRHLFEFSLKEFVSFNYKIEDISLDLHKEDLSLNVLTEYEKKFSEKGNPIYKVVVKK